MPVLYQDEPAVTLLPPSYSPATVERRFEIVDQLFIGNATLLILYDSALPFAAVIDAQLAEIKNEARHPVVATLELQYYPQRQDILCVHEYWQDDETLQTEGGTVAKRWRDQGLATALYESLVTRKGLTLMSDNHHYAAGKALWQKIARTSDKLAIYVLDMQRRLFYPYDGYRLRYNAETIPEEAIWSIHPDRERYGIVLIAEGADKHIYPHSRAVSRPQRMPVVLASEP